MFPGTEASWRSVYAHAIKLSLQRSVAAYKLPLDSGPWDAPTSVMCLQGVWLGGC